MYEYNGENKLKMYTQTPLFSLLLWGIVVPAGKTILFYSAPLGSTNKQDSSCFIMATITDNI